MLLLEEVFKTKVKLFKLILEGLEFEIIIIFQIPGNRTDICIGSLGSFF